MGKNYFYFFVFIGEAGPGGGVPEGESARPEQPGGGTPVAAPGGGGEDQHGGTTAPGTVLEPIRILLVKHGDPDPTL